MDIYVHHLCTMHYTIQLHTQNTSNGIKLHWNLSIANTLGHSLPSGPHRAVYKSSFELGAPSIQDSQQGPIDKERFHCISKQMDNYNSGDSPTDRQDVTFEVLQVLH